ncbi:calcium/sodium antiporter [Thalassotalea profundi]|uniref:Sodium:calcium antiporter n=1 Tax=Thalassotalea profundi TaxID=2036687 RepID=A0ABQ3IS98_9GAMM|nr:calcium/sodium antiporter [Thalassotalea profundi]GHE93112.1 sodium:calcium antiporter [Thalassotalea profundi]
MFVQILILLLSLIVLVWSADKFVFGASALARNFGISPMIIGLTIVAMGSSAPEMMISTTASLQGNVNTAIGNAIGSNITNIALVLGITALLHPLTVSSTTVKREIPLILAITAIAYFMLYDHEFSYIEGLILMLGFVVYIVALLMITLRNSKQKKTDDALIIGAEHDVPKTTTPNAIFWLIIGMVLLPLSAKYLVNSSVFIATAFGVSDLVIGLTVIAIGTSLPELAASIMSIIKKEDDLAIGNIIGSNIFNILAVLSLAGLIAPGNIDQDVALRDAPYMLAVTLFLFFLCFSRRLGNFRITRLKGFALILTFISYQILLFSQLKA